MKIKDLISKSYTCILFVFLALYMILIRLNANDKTVLYCIFLMLGAIFVTICVFLLNKCRKKQARLFYLISISLISFFVILQAIYYLIVKYVFIDNVELYSKTNHIFIWILRIMQALFLTSSLLAIYYIVKDYFKKDYSFDKYDFQIIQMIINILCYIAIVYIHFDYAGYSITEIIDPVTYQSIGKSIEFTNDNIAVVGTLIVIGLYVVQYVIIEIIKYQKYEKGNQL